MSAPLAGDLVKASDAFKLNSYTPTLTNITLGSGGLNDGWYQTIGNFVLWGFRIQLGTSPAITSNALVSLPVAAYTGGGTSLQACLGSWVLRDDNSSSPQQNFGGPMSVFEAAGINACFGGAWDATAPRQRVTTGVPITYQVSDVLAGSGCYRSA